MCVYVKGVWLVLADCLSWQFVANMKDQSDFTLQNENKLTCCEGRTAVRLIICLPSEEGQRKVLVERRLCSFNPSVGVEGF